MKINKSGKSQKKPILVAIAVLFVACTAYCVYAYNQQIWPFEARDLSSDTTVSEPKVNKPATRDELGDKQSINEKGASTDTDGTGVIDNNGSSAENNSGGISSTSGDITLYTPSEGQTLSTSLSVSGTAKVESVHYRIKDNINGVIGQGELNVVNGTFGGELKVNTTATSGSFEIYSMDQQGREINHVKVNVKY